MTPMDLTAATPSLRYHVSVEGYPVPRHEEIFTPEALDFLRQLHRRFSARRHELLDDRFRRRQAGTPLGFLAETQEIRDDPSWRVPPPAPGLELRQVELAGAVNAKMAINALNSGADVWMADFEDAMSPTWGNLVAGQLNLKDAIAGTLSIVDSKGQEHTLTKDSSTTIVVRPRGWHLLERHIKVDAEPIPGALVDFGLFLHHSVATLTEKGLGPYFYLPKLENHLEARLWHDVFSYAEKRFDLAPGTIRATVIIETISAAFEMEEILYELGEHAAGLSPGRWDYIFSAVKTFCEDPAFVLPDRSNVTMTAPFMRAFTNLLVKTCHKRGAYAIGGVVASQPRDSADPAVAALRNLRVDKEREVRDGFDGSWVAHPRLIAECRRVFRDALGDAPNQLDNLREDVEVDASDLLAVSATQGAVTANGVAENVAVLVRYLDAWLKGRGAVSIDGQGEDASTTEISRCQLWQWIRHGTVMEGSQPITRELVTALIEKEVDSLAETSEMPPGHREALLDVIRFGALEPELPSFMTEYAYRHYLLPV